MNPLTPFRVLSIILSVVVAICVWIRFNRNPKFNGTVRLSMAAGVGAWCSANLYCLWAAPSTGSGMLVHVATWAFFVALLRVSYKIGL